MVMTATASMYNAIDKAELSLLLCRQIARISLQCIEQRGSFTVAVSGGSLPALLSKIHDVYVNDLGVANPPYESWHVILADERCVPMSDKDSNLGAFYEHVVKKIQSNVTFIPESQIYGINESQLSVSTDAVAKDYQGIVERVLLCSMNMLDLAVLGFGPDGHTCSLFPGHPLLNESTRLVAPIDDSPKPPASRITLTYKVLNEMTRNVIFCGAGSSKAPILSSVFSDISWTVGNLHFGQGTYNSNQIYPCGMVQPKQQKQQQKLGNNNIIWMIDQPVVDSLSPIVKQNGMLSRTAIVKIGVDKDKVSDLLCNHIVECYQEREDADKFVIALSGGSAAALLQKLCTKPDIDWSKWHVILADERCVPKEDNDSNYKSLLENFLQHTTIPTHQIYGINEAMLSISAAAVADDYQAKLQRLMKDKSMWLDVAVLGFGPDGHTCSLFPNDVSSCYETTKLVTFVENSPKPPPRRITLTFPVLNQQTKKIVVCGMGTSKTPILEQVIDTVVADPKIDKSQQLKITLSAPSIELPVGMVYPQSTKSMTFIVDTVAIPDYHFAI